MSLNAFSKLHRFLQFPIVRNTTSNIFPICDCRPTLYIFRTSVSGNNTNQPENAETKKKKSPIIPKITLLSGDDISVTTLEEAQKISKRRDLKLVKIVDFDVKTHRSVYKLMTGSEYQSEELKQREQRKLEKKGAIKGEKVVMLNANISQHDLQTQCNKIRKWIGKLFEVRLVINGSSNVDSAEKVYHFIEKELNGEARFLQKRLKGSDIKFQIIPPKNNKNNDDNGL